MCNNKTQIKKVRFTVDFYLNFEELIKCPQCHGNIFICDIDESELQKLCDGAEIVIECPHCMADYSVNPDLKVEIVRRCRNCDDEGETYVDCFNPYHGHFNRVVKCECCGSE